MSQASLRVSLSEVEDQHLFELRDAVEVPKRTRMRAEMLRLSHRGWTSHQIAEYLGCCTPMVRRAIHRWHSEGIAGLYDQPRSGRPRRWQEADLAYIDDQLEKDSQTFNSRQVSALLAQERQVQLSQRHIRRLLRKRGIDGSGPARVIGVSKTGS